MRRPVWQQEWQRRQHQRSVLALLGLLAIVSGAPSVAPALAPPGPAPAAAEQAEIVVVQPPSQSLRGRSSDDVQRRYWAAIEPNLASRVRLALRRQAAWRPAAARRAAWLRRFLRPPTA